MKNLKPLQLEYPVYQTLSQNLYEEEYNSLLFNPENHPGKIIDGVKVVDAGTEFNIILRADGAFSNDGNVNKNINYYELWNSPIRSNYSFSNSHISNSRLLMYALQSEEKLVSYAFCNLPRNSIVENSLGDNATILNRKKTIDPRAYKDEDTFKPYSFDGGGQIFLPFKLMIDNSSNNIHTEVSLERFYYDDSGKEFRLNPSYIVYTKVDDDYEKDDLYKKSLKAAKDFGISLVIIDMKNVLESEREKMNYYINQPLNIGNIKKTLQIYFNNSVKGLSNKYQNMINTYFPESINNQNYCEMLVSQIIDKAKSQSMPEDFFQQLFDYLMVLNVKKNIISDSYLISMKEKLSLKENFNKYYDEIFGITYRDYDDKEKSDCFHSYFAWKKIIDKLKKYNIESKELIKMNNFTLQYRIDLCEKEEIIPNESILMFSEFDFVNYISNEKKKKREKELSEMMEEFNNQENFVNDADDLSMNSSVWVDF